MPTTTQPLPAPSTDDVFNLTQEEELLRLTNAYEFDFRAGAPVDTCQVWTWTPCFSYSPQPAQRVEARSPRERKPKRCFCCGDDVCSAALAHQDAPGTEAPRGGLQPKRTRCDGGRRHEAR